MQAAHKFIAIHSAYVRCWRQSVSHFQCSFGKDERGLTVIKNRTVAQKVGSVMFAGLMAVSAGVSVAAAPAFATTCSSDKERDEVPLDLDKFRATASCSTINASHKVRAKLIRDGGPDYESSWFTTENKTYRTSWVTCYAGCSDSYEIANR